MIWLMLGVGGVTYLSMFLHFLCQKDPYHRWTEIMAWVFIAVTVVLVSAAMWGIK